MQVQIPTQAFGTMSMTTVPNPAPFSESVKVLQYLYDKYDVRLFNSGSIYQLTEEFNNVELFIQFYKTRPDPNTVFVYKTGVENVGGKFELKGDKQSLYSQMDVLLERFKKVDQKPQIVVEIARIDRTVPIEESVSAMYDYVKAGKIAGVGVSECNAKTLELAAKTAPLSCLELEFSLMAQEIVHNDVLKVASQYGIPILAYSPLQKGFLTDLGATSENFLKASDKPETAFFQQYEKMNSENFDNNKVLVDKLYQYARNKGIPLEALALSYLHKVSGAANFEGIKKVAQIVPIPSGKSEARVDSNYGHIVDLSDAELEEIQAIVRDNKVHGGRYFGVYKTTLEG